MPLSELAFDQLRQTSRTFVLPIMALPEPLQAAVGAAYLAFRAIDEIEDHPNLPASAKSELLRQIGLIGQSSGDVSSEQLTTLLDRDDLPLVTRELPRWLDEVPGEIRTRVADAVATMADRMAHWVEVDFRIESKDDLDRYTFAVAGGVGLLLAELWDWHAGEKTDRHLAVQFGRGLQSVNIVLNVDDDATRGCSFTPTGWEQADLIRYAERCLGDAEEYTRRIQHPAIKRFCQLPLSLATASLQVAAAENRKLTRSEVEAIYSET